MNIQQCAERALEILSEKGWADNWHDAVHTEKVCAGQAVSMMMRELDFNGDGHCDVPEARELWDNLQKYAIDLGFDSVPRWNDYKLTSEEDIRLGIKRAAENG